MAIKCLALFGPPGAGKSTASRGLEKLCRNRGITFRLLKLAEPLYRCQAAIYEAAGRPLADGYTQDGELLNFLGSHLRKINPTALTDDFEKRFSNELKTLQFICNGSSLVVCDDMRPAEVEYMQSRAFALLRLETPMTICAERRRARGDITLGAADHVTERGFNTTVADHVIPNVGTIDDLNHELGQLLDGLFT